MNIDNYKYIWTSEKDSHVLVETEFGYAIINGPLKSTIYFSDSKLEDEVIKNMLDAGCQVYGCIQEAYSSFDS